MVPAPFKIPEPWQGPRQGKASRGLVPRLVVEIRRHVQGAHLQWVSLEELRERGHADLSCSRRLGGSRPEGPRCLLPGDSTRQGARYHLAVRNIEPIRDAIEVCVQRDFGDE